MPTPIAASQASTQLDPSQEHEVKAKDEHNCKVADIAVHTKSSRDYTITS